MMNKVQNAYATAKAAYETARENQKAAEYDFLARNGVKTPDGTTPTALWVMGDFLPEDEYDALEIALCEDEACAAAFNQSLDASKALKLAEDALIEYGLKIAPAGIRETLKNGMNRTAIRNKMLDLVFRLDTRTVTA